MIEYNWPLFLAAAEGNIMMNEHKANLLEEIEYCREQEESFIDSLATVTGKDDRDYYAKMARIYFRLRIRAERELNECLSE